MEETTINQNRSNNPSTMENPNPNESPNDDWNSRNCPYDQDTTWYELLPKLMFNVITLGYFNRRAIDEDYTEEDSEEDKLEHDSDSEEEDYDWLELTRLCDICENQVQDDTPVFECQRCSSVVCDYCDRELGRVWESILEDLMVCTVCWTPADNADEDEEV